MYQQLRNVSVGDKFVIRKYGWGRNPETYSRPLEIIKVTKTQVTLEAETEDAKPRRFLRTTMREVGKADSWRSDILLHATEEQLAEIDKHNKEIAEKQAEEDAEKRQAEVALRDKYRATTIIDDELQDKFLAPLRKMAETGEKKMNGVLKEFEGVSVEAGNFYRIASTMKRSVEGGDFEYGQRLREMATDTHEEMVEMITAWASGTRYKAGDREVTDKNDLCMTFVRAKLNRLLDRFFNYRLNRDAITDADQKFISELRSILGDNYNYERVSQIKENDDA